MAMHVAKKVVIDLEDSTVSIDGAVFPYYLDQRGVDIERLGSTDSLALVILPLIAEMVEVLPKRPES